MNSIYHDLPYDRKWSRGIMQKVEDYIHNNYALGFRETSKQRLSTNTPVNARMLLEWHNTKTCPFKLEGDELAEVQKAAGIEPE